VLKEFGTGDKVLFRVFLSGFKSEGEARDFIKTDHFKGSFIINLE
jgi:hypothetical protein